MLLSEQKNTNFKGNAGIGSAIAYFTSEGLTVSLPLNDTQDYDMIVDFGELKKVQVKTTTFLTDSGNYKVDLRTTGGNQSFHTAKLFDYENIDFIYILTESNERFLIPCADGFENKNSITLSEKYKKYLL